jgi:hypothetical protein
MSIVQGKIMTRPPSRTRYGSVSKSWEASALPHTILSRSQFRPADELSAFSLTFSHIANINVFLSSMAHFVPLNAVYTTYFGVSPPARACVSVDLPPGVRVKLDCIAFAEQTPVDRQALHVQGLSYWAPANIGPYSQAITVRAGPCIYFNALDL